MRAAVLTLTKCALVVAALFASFCAQSQGTSSWSFYDIRLADLTRVAYSQLLGRSFVADDALVNDTRRVSLELKPADIETASQVVRELLLDAGYVVDDSRPVLKIRKKESKDDDSETLIYRPRFRSAQYLIDVLGLGSSSKQSATSGSSTSSGANASTAASTNNWQQQANSAAQYLDRSADIVVVKRERAALQQVRAALEAIDTAEEQLDITAVVYEFSTTERNQTALGAVFDIAKGKLTAQAGALQAVGDFLRLDVGGVQLLASLLNTDSRFTLVSSPKLRVKSGARARVQVGADVPTLGAITQQNGVSTQSVTYQKTGVTLDVLPTILREVVSLDVRQSITEAQSTTTGVNNSPTLTTREVSSQLLMRSGESVVLAGLQSTRDNRSRSGLPFVPSWLQSKSDDAQRTELVVFLSVSKP